MKTLLALPVALAVAMPSVAGEKSAPNSAAAVADVSILPGWRTEDGTHMAALKVTLAPGWKTYWRAPGDAGIPPRFAWNGSRNIEGVRFHWPRPEVYQVNGMRSIGYYGELVLPMEFTPREVGESITVRAEIEIGVCQEICVPMTAHVSAELPPGGPADPRISAWLDRKPEGGRAAGVASVSCRIEPISDGLRLTARIEMPSLGKGEVAVFELADQQVWVSESANSREGRHLVATSDLVPPSGGPFLLDRSSVRITVLGEERAVELSGCPAG